MDQTTPFIYPGDNGAKLNPSSRYENFIGGEWQKPKSGNYFENISTNAVWTRQVIATKKIEIPVS